MMQLILAIDPGETTGLVVGERTGSKTFDVLEAYDIPWKERFRVPLKLFGSNFDVVVVEDFRLYHHSRVSQVNSDFPTVRMIGMVELAMYMRYGTEKEIRKQPASSTKNVQIEERHEFMLKGLHHAKSAYQHLRYYVLVTHKQFETD